MIFVSGTVGDGVTDDAYAIKAACNAAPEGETLVFPCAHYYLTNVEIDKALTLDFQGSDLTVAPGLNLASSKPAIEFAGSLGDRLPIDPVTVEGTDRVVLQSGTAATFFAPGDYVEIYDQTPVPGWDVAAGGGASYTYAGRKEINRVKGVLGSTVFFEKSVEWLYDVNASIAKLDPLFGPRIVNVGTIREVNPGGPYAGSTIGGPHIFRFHHCIDPVVSGARVEGWQMDVCQFTACVNPLFERVTAANPFRPTSPGHGYLVQFDRSTGGLARENVTHQTRHTVDFTQSYDCLSERNTAFAPYGTQFTGHGQGAKRCKSIDDTIYFGGSVRPLGWSWGNPSFSKDYGFEVIRPTAVGRCDGEYSCIVFNVTSGSEGLKIVDPFVSVSSPSNYVKVLLDQGGARDTSMTGGEIDLSAVSASVNSGAVRAESYVAGSTHELAPVNLSVKGTKITGSPVANGSAIWAVQLSGSFRVSDVEFHSSGNQHNIRVGTTPLDEIEIERTRHFNGGKRMITVEAAPVERYRVRDNFGSGVFTGGKVSLPASPLLNLAEIA